jgi:hypothetical protein
MASLFWPRKKILGIFVFLKYALSQNSCAETTEQEAALQRRSDLCISSFISGNIFSLFSIQYHCNVRGQQRYKPRRQRPQRSKKGRSLKVETNEKVKGKMENVSHCLLGISRRTYYKDRAQIILCVGKA